MNAKGPRTSLSALCPPCFRRGLGARIFLLVLLVVFKASLDLGYTYFVVPVFGYTGEALAFDPTKFVVSYFLTAAVGWLVLRRPGHLVSTVGSLFLFIFVVVPIYSRWALTDEPSLFVLWVTMAFVLLLMFLSVPRIRLPRVPPATARLAFLAATVGLAALTFTVAGARGAFDEIRLNFANVYDWRGDVHETVLTGPFVYVWAWTGKVILPLLLVYTLISGRYVSSVAVIVLSVLLFGISSHKEFAFYPVIVTGLFMVGRSNVDLFQAVLGGLSALVLGALLLHVTLGDIWGGLLIIYRSFAVVARNHFDYYSFFQEHSFVLFTNSTLEPLAPYPFEQPVPEMIGRSRYQQGEIAFANTGFLGSAYMQMGVLGMMVYGSFTGLLLRAYDSVTRDLDSTTAVAATAVPILQLVNVDLTIALMTQGMALSILLVWLLNSCHPAWSVVAMRSQRV